MRGISNALARNLGRKGLVLEKHAPTLLFGAGVAGMVGSTVLACQATLKVEAILHDAKRDLEMAKTIDHPNYSEKDRGHDVSVIYIRSAVKLARLYAPAIGMGVAAVGCLTKSHNMLAQRNAALTAAYIALEEGFQKYRERVIEDYGQDVDRNFRYGSREVEELDAKGHKKTVTRVGLDEPSIYAKFFDPSSSSWQTEPEYNLYFLRCQQNYANDMLRARGHLFLNEVYDSLGLPRTKAGAVVGWVMQSRRGDHFVDFGIFDGEDNNARDFVNGYEGSILLDFNVDGIIYDLIEGDNDVD